MQTNEWGPGAWTFLHACTFAQEKNIPPEQQERLRTFFNLVGHMLPCSQCQKHYREYVEKHPVPTETREKLTRWLVDLHNQVNVITDNPFIQNMMYEDVCDVYAYDHEPVPSSSSSKPAKTPARTARSVVLACTAAVLILVAAGLFFLMYTSCRQGRCPMVKPR